MYKRAGFHARVGFVCAHKSARQYTNEINNLLFFAGMASPPLVSELKPRFCDQTGLWTDGRMLTRDCPTLGPKTLRSIIL